MLSQSSHAQYSLECTTATNMLLSTDGRDVMFHTSVSTLATRVKSGLMFATSEMDYIIPILFKNTV